MKKLTLILSAVLCGGAFADGKDAVKVSDFGWNAEDATEIVQDVLTRVLIFYCP